mgnify:CR=1 FL=1
MREYLWLFLLLLILAAVFRDDAVFLLFYLLAGVFLVSHWWSRRALAAVTFERRFTERAFPGETVTIRLRLRNRGWLPVVWLRLLDSAPTELLSRPQSLLDVISLGPLGETELSYDLQTYKRGYYRLGPLFLTSGDLLGLEADIQRQGGVDGLIVYPRLVALTQLGLPSHAPLGALRHRQPIYEDPARTAGKRDYVSGDSLRRLDWKTTAAVGRLQVKVFEPSIALTTMVALNLSVADYDLRTRYDATELAIVVAASLANWSTGQGQPVGLAANGLDSVYAGAPPVLPPRKGRAHLMRLLEVLARLQPAEAAPPLADLLRRQAAGLPWGATLIVITGSLEATLAEVLLGIRQAGLNAVLMVVGPAPGPAEVRGRLARLGVASYHIWNERDLDRWRGKHGR